ncbi:MAG: 30S ribosomal protein S16 [Acidimicrobiia bacterium]|nr:30S ribosomal protein S16 [Acidimicrobiia bacterium]
MAVKIRLRRMGKKKQPTYRVVVADARSPRDGRIIESIGRYDPRREPSLVEIDNDRARYWLGTGAQPTDRVQKLLEISGAVAQPKVSRAGVYRLDDPPQSPPPDPDVTESPEAAEDSAVEEPGAAPEEDETPADDQQDGEA